jgi:hypothetical protein
VLRGPDRSLNPWHNEESIIQKWVEMQMNLPIITLEIYDADFSVGGLNWLSLSKTEITAIELRHTGVLMFGRMTAN